MTTLALALGGVSRAATRQADEFPFDEPVSETCRTLANGVVECVVSNAPRSSGGISAVVGALLGSWLLGAALCLYAGRDMERRGQSGFVWGALVFFGGLPGVFVWRLMRKGYPIVPRRPQPESPYGPGVSPGSLPWSDWRSPTDQ